MAWIIVFIAGLLEVVWAYYMKLSEGFTKLVPSVITIVAMVASFALLSFAMRSLPLGTAYMVWTGIGAVGAFAVGAIFLGEAASPLRIAAAIMIVCGILLMKFATDSGAPT
jgi:quaternary ammonium compound-resistance protein SugE